MSANTAFPNDNTANIEYSHVLMPTTLPTCFLNTLKPPIRFTFIHVLVHPYADILTATTPSHTAPIIRLLAVTTAT